MPSKNTIRKRAQRKHPILEKCQDCGTPPPLERHHPDYSDPERVEILCPPCHVKADKRDGTRPTKPPKPCAVCGTLFNYTHTRVKACGPTCRAELGRLAATKRWGGRSKMKTCATCSREFTYKRPRDKTCGRAECVNSLKRSATLRRWRSA